MNQVAINDVWAILEALCEENLNTDTEGKLSLSFLETIRTRLTRFDQWADKCLRAVQPGESSTHPKTAARTSVQENLQSSIATRWSRLGSLLGRLQILERERVSLLHSVDILPDDNTLVPSLDSEHPRIKLGRRITLLELQENIVISELGSVSKRSHKTDPEPKKAAQRLWAERVIEIRTEQLSKNNIFNIEFNFEIKMAHAILEDKIEAFEQIGRESREWCLARESLENYAQHVSFSYKGLDVLRKSYRAGDSFSDHKLERWKILSRVVEVETCFIAGSLQLGEGRFAMDIFSELRKQAESARPILLVAPSTEEVEPEIEAHSRNQESGFSIKRLSCLSEGDKGQVDVIIIDTWGMLADVYSLGSGTLLGGTFLTNRHHSYTESLLWGVPVFTGYHQHDQECVIHLVNQGTQKLVHQISTDETSVVIEEWKTHLHGGLPESIRDRNQLSFIKQIASIEPQVFETFQWLSPQLIYWIKELGANHNYDECPFIDELTYLHIIWLGNKISPWILDLLEKYESGNHVFLIRAIESIERETKKS